MTKSLKERDIQGIKILSKLIEEKELLSEGELKILAEFLKSSISNIELNALLINLDVEEKKAHLFNDQALYVVIGLSFRTRFLKKIPADLFDRTAGIYKKLIQKEKLLETDKLSFPEYANLLELAYLLDDLKMFEKHGILKLDPELEKLHKQASHGKNLDSFFTKKQIKKQWKHAIRFLMRKVISPFMEYFQDIRQKDIITFTLPENKDTTQFKKKK